MILVVGVVVVVLAVPLCGGTFRGLDRDGPRGGGWMVAALVGQVPLGALSDSWLPRSIFVLTFIVMGAFVVRNWSLPGMRLMAVGGASNLAAIVSNGGVMPAWSWAWRVSGAPVLDAAHFANARPGDDAWLLPLGDIIPFPSGLPGSAPFSVGDVLLLAGFALLIHSQCGSAWAVRGAKRRGAGTPDLWRWRHVRATRT